MKLIGDIGGTKTLLALVDATGAIVHKTRAASADFSDFSSLLAEYLRAAPASIDGACLAVAGPVSADGRRANITNLPWRIEAAELEARFHLGRLQLINDFTGVALGVVALGADGLVTMQTGDPCPGGMKLVVGAGTGLGVAAMHGDHILPSEGGHIAFGPADATQERIWSALQEEYGRVTAERVISGPGLAAIHRILTGESATPDSIGERALSGDGLACRSVDVFLSCYGAYVGDMALAFLAFGGIYLAGGVIQKLLPLATKSPFLPAFNAKAEHADLVGRMSVQVVTDSEVGLLGAALQERRRAGLS